MKKSVDVLLAGASIVIIVAGLRAAQPILAPLLLAVLLTAEYLEEWTDKAGEDNLGADPPNAALSVYEPGQPDSTVAIVEITHPVVEGADLIYTYELIDGSMPLEGGAAALFIDKIGVGGGVGVGYHGVGVGARGPGVR